MPVDGILSKCIPLLLTVDSREIRTTENTSCAELPGTWTDFSEFSACSVSCGEGVKVKTRQCVGGRCQGASQISKKCKRNCPLGES